ncbi:hypothetical protein JCM6882_000131 [Rhodosporidiobolus microsporus]
MLRTAATHVLKRTKTTSAKEAATAAAAARQSKPEPTSTTHAPQSSKVQATSAAAKAEADYKAKLEERFGGGEAAALGELVNGVPQGMQRGVQKNLFRLI